jgi:hypothetical protein
MVWTPSCIGQELSDDTKWRILTDGEWFYIECKGSEDEQWQGGLSGTKEFLGLTEEEARRAYPKKKEK